MAELKTKKTTASVKEFLDAVDDDQRRKDGKKVSALMRKITGKKPEMWGPGIVGFGKWHYKYASGREGDWFLTGFAPRKQALTLYIMSGLQDSPTLKKLGKYKTGKGCLYIKKLEDVDMKVLEKLIRESVKRKAG